LSEEVIGELIADKKALPMVFGFYLLICLFGIKVTGINIRTICFQQKLYGFHEVKAFQLLDKTNDVATLAAAETLKHVQREIHSTNHRECAGVFTSKWAAVNAIVKNHRIELDEFFDEDEIEKTSKRVLEAEARRRLRKELDFAYQTQGYETNYDIEVWNINEWYLTKY